MKYVIAVLLTIALASLGYGLSHQLLPWALRRALGALGYRMHLTPLMARRVRRFRSIRRGYWSFVVVTSLFTTSLFLELVVSNHALLIHHRGSWAMPAVREWAGLWIPFGGISGYESGSDWGLPEEGRFNHRKYEAGAVAERLQAEERSYQEASDRFAKMEPTPPPQSPAEPVPPVEPTAPGPDAPEEERRAYEKNLSVFRRAYSDYEFALQLWEIEKRDFEKRLLDGQPESEYDRLKADLPKREKILEQLRELHEDLETGEAGVVMPIYPYGPEERILDVGLHPPYRPGEGGLLLGATDNGADVLVQLAYGFRNSIVFALIVAGIGYTIGTLFGGVMGYYGGTIDILMQRFVEIWESIPFLFTIMIIASILQPGLFLLALLLIVLRGWIGITYTIRGEFYREKAKDYVQAAIAMGAGDGKIITRHILPNSLVPIVSFAPFGIVAYITVLVSLDYLGFGLKPGTPSWGYLLKQGHEYLISYPHLILVPSIALAATLFCVVIIGESVREAFDPKVFSRLR